MSISVMQQTIQENGAKIAFYGHKRQNVLGKFIVLIIKVTGLRSAHVIKYYVSIKDNVCIYYMQHSVLHNDIQDLNTCTARVC